MQRMLLGQACIFWPNEHPSQWTRPSNFAGWANIMNDCGELPLSVFSLGMHGSAVF